MAIHPSSDLLIYAAHVGFWGAFVATRLVVSSSQPAAPEAAPATTAADVAPYSRLLLAIHMVAFGVMYFGIAQAVIPNRVPHLFPGQRILATTLIAAGAALSMWALLSFRSWRFRAKLDEGHQLATGGPFRLMRHPIYSALNLLALGTAIWIPTPIVWIGFVLMVIGSDLRGRSEEALLLRTFGDVYRDYSRRTRRFIPGVY
jgi:protein-S-isoprenylcysteine O-methyltransferase Ste14